MPADEIDDEKNRKRHAEQPKKGVTDLAGLTDELFEVFHNNPNSAGAVGARVWSAALG